MEESEEESKIIKEIKELCYVNGREKYPKQSAELFFKLGKIYAVKTDKISAIQSAALINAALVREPKNAEEIQSDLKGFCRKVLLEANSEVADVCLVEIAKTIKLRLNLMRKNVESDISKIRSFPDWATWAEEQLLLHLEKEKIHAIKVIQAKVTNDYKKIMSDIAHTVEETMKNLPCQYALVGMGSLAREEVTPYSDFECILVLEEGVQNKKSYESVLECFRWYAVIFQLILINLGETLIPSVAIRQLNDFSSKNRDWFYDAFTPCGISFDGMMPHASKSPLGRQQTLCRPWKTELIKPVSEMVKYLGCEEDLKNGYHLAELLSKICFVSGSKSVFDDFNLAVVNQLRENRTNLGYFERIQQTIIEDQQKFDLQFNMSKLLSDGLFDVKTIMYRSITIFVSALGRIHGITSSSCFSIIEELENNLLISNIDKHKLQYAVAVACEIRLKLYMKKKRQCNILENKTTARSAADFVGLRSTLDACVIADYLQNYVVRLCKMKDSSQNLNHIFSSETKSRQNNDNILKLKIMCTLQYHNECIYLARDCIESISLHEMQYDLISYQLLLYSYACSAISLYNLHRPLESLAMLENIQPFLTEETTTQQMDLFEFNLTPRMLDYERTVKQFVYAYIGFIYLHLKMYDDALLSFKRRKSETEEHSAKDEGSFFNELQYALYEACCLMKLKRLNEAIHLLEETRILASTNKENLHEFHIKCIATHCTMDLGKCLYKLQKYDEAMTKFCQTLELHKQDSLAEDSDFNVALLKLYVGKCLYMTNIHDKALEYFEEVSEYLKHNEVNQRTQKLAKKNRLFQGRTLFKLKRYSEALEYFLLDCSI